MFGKLKSKLKGWFTKSKETIEETAPKEEARIKEIPEKKHKKDKEKKEEIKAKKEKTKKQDKAKEDKLEAQHEIVTEKKQKPKKEGDKIEAIEEEIQEIEKTIEEAKKEKIKEAPLKFEVAKQKFEPDIEEIQEKKKTFFQKIKSTFSYQITKEGFNEIFEELEMLLLENNVALEVLEDIKEKLSKKLIGKEIIKEELEEEIKKELKKTLNEILIEPDNPLEIIEQKKQGPFVILFFGINGTGKTTSIAKLASYLKKSKHSVVLAAADTFRAASIEQLSEHAKKLKVPIIKQDYKSDPAAVGFDAIKYAQKHGIDVVLIDTAGRMHTKTNLMSEMEKIVRVTNPDLKIFVAESIAGNDATEQARTFNESIGIDGSILSKADIDEKGGTIISISNATNKPIFYLGIGQEYKDLELFNKQRFIESLGL